MITPAHIKIRDTILALESRKEALRTAALLGGTNNDFATENIHLDAELTEKWMLLREVHPALGHSEWSKLIDPIEKLLGFPVVASFMRWGRAS